MGVMWERFQCVAGAGHKLTRRSGTFMAWRGMASAAATGSLTMHKQLCHTAGSQQCALLIEAHHGQCTPFGFFASAGHSPAAVQTSGTSQVPTAALRQGGMEAVTNQNLLVALLSRPCGTIGPWPHRKSDGCQHGSRMLLMMRRFDVSCLLWCADHRGWAMGPQQH